MKNIKNLLAATSLAVLIFAASASASGGIVMSDRSSCDNTGIVMSDLTGTGIVMSDLVGTIFNYFNTREENNGTCGTGIVMSDRTGIVMSD